MKEQALMLIFGIALGLMISFALFSIVDMEISKCVTDDNYYYQSAVMWKNEAYKCYEERGE